MRILLVHNYYKIQGGEDIVVANEKKLLEENGNEVFLYTRNNKEMDKMGFFQKFLLPFEIFFSIKTYKDINHLIKEKNIDIVHVHNTVCLISPSVFYAAFKSKVPVVQTIHNFRLLCPAATFLRDGHICDECVVKGLFNACKYNCYRNSKIQTFGLSLTEYFNKKIGTYSKLFYICLTDFNKKQLLRINDKKTYISSKQIFVKPNFIIHSHKCIPFSERQKQVVYAGRLDSSKGIKILFESWKEIKDIDLIVCGNGPLDKWCLDFVKSNKINNIKMLGHVDNEKVISLISKSIATILPTQWYEGFPMIVVESFSCGTPVIGSNIGNVNSIIKEGVNGFHIDPYNKDSIINCVNSVSDICESTFKHANQNYSATKNYKILIGIYKKMLEES